MQHQCAVTPARSSMKRRSQSARKASFKTPKSSSKQKSATTASASRPVPKPRRRDASATTEVKVGIKRSKIMKSQSEDTLEEITSTAVVTPPKSDRTPCSTPKSVPNLKRQRSKRLSRRLMSLGVAPAESAEQAATSNSPAEVGVNKEDAALSNEQSSMMEDHTQDLLQKCSAEDAFIVTSLRNQMKALIRHANRPEPYNVVECVKPLSELAAELPQVVDDLKSKTEELEARHEESAQRFNLAIVRAQRRKDRQLAKLSAELERGAEAIYDAHKHVLEADPRQIIADYYKSFAN